jgi:hypothetical protein
MGRPVITNAFGFPDHQKSDLQVKIAFEQEADLEEAKLVGDNASKFAFLFVTPEASRSSRTGTTVT